MRIGIDIDGVLADFVKSHRELIHQFTDIRLAEPSDTWPDVWDYHKAAGITKEDDSKVWDAIKSSPYFWATLHPYPGAVDAVEWLNYLSRTANEVYFITSRPGTRAKFQTEFWLRNLGMDNPTVLIVKDWRDKAPIVNALKLHVFVEDKPETNQLVKAQSASTRTYLIDRPYNRYPAVDHTYGYRVKNVEEVLEREEARGSLKEAA